MKQDRQVPPKKQEFSGKFIQRNDKGIPKNGSMGFKPSVTNNQTRSFKNNGNSNMKNFGANDYWSDDEIFQSNQLYNIFFKNFR